MPELRTATDPLPRAEAGASADGLVAVDRRIPGLYATAPERLPFAQSVAIRAFVLRRERGNLLVYSTASLGSAAGPIEQLGGVSRQYLSHRHEAMFASSAPTPPLFVHERERRGVERTMDVRATFSRRHHLDEDFEVIPIPGHASGSTAYLWDSGAGRLLFTGDSVYLADGEWRATVLDSSDRDAYLTSLELIRELDFDVLVPWATTAGEPYHDPIADPTEARRRIDAIHGRVARGEDH